MVGDGIDTITYSLEQGTFYKKQEASEEEANDATFKENTEYAGTMSKEYVGEDMLGDKQKTQWLLKKAESSYTVAYEEQNTLTHLYAISVTAKLTNGTKPLECYKDLAKELSKQTIDVTIKYKDGHTVEKKILFSNNNAEVASKMVSVKWANK